MQSLFDDDPLDWKQNKLYQFMQSLKCSKKLLDAQQNTLKFDGADFIMKSEEEIIRFYKATTPEEQNQMREVRRQIIQKNSQFKSFEGDKSDYGCIAESVQVDVTGNYYNTSSNMDMKANQTLEISNKNIALEEEIEFKLYDLPFDPFDFDAPMNYEKDKREYDAFIKGWPLYQKFIDFKQKRSLNRKIETQFVLEIKRPSDSNEGGTTSLTEKFVVKENQQITLGSQNCSLVLRDKAVSRKHALIENIDGVFSIQDQGSSCGTFIRVREQPIPLKQGSIFECGFQEFQIKSIKPSGDSAKVQLIISDGIEQYKGKVFDLNVQNFLLIGNNIHCHFGSQFSEDKEFSPYHAKLVMQDNALTIIDLGSQKGTWVRLSPQKEPSQKFQIYNSTEIKINPFIITVKVSQMDKVK